MPLIHRKFWASLIVMSNFEHYTTVVLLSAKLKDVSPTNTPHSLRTAKRLYYEKKLNNVQSNTRATWKVLNEILNRSKRNSNRYSTFKADDREVTDPVEIANKFYSYFSSIGLKQTSFL